MAVTSRFTFTQPETLVAIFGVILVYFLTLIEAGETRTSLLSFLHISSVSLLTGMLFWVSLIAGLTMFRILPRHQFSQVQGQLFPKYFAYSILFSGIALGTFYLIMKEKEAIFYKIAGLLVAFITSVLNYGIVHPFNAIIRERNEFEARQNVGKGIGNDNKEVKKLKEENEEYAVLYNKVFKLHGLTSLLNLVTFAGVVTHLCLLSFHISFH